MLQTVTAAPVPSRALLPRLTPRRADQLTIVLPALLAAALCAIELGTRSLWLDEGATIAIASQHGAALWRGIAHDGGNMLAYYLLMHAIIGLFGDGSTVIRLPSLIADAATGAIVAALGLRLFADRRVALSAGLLSAVSLPLVFWGQDARGYAWMAALGAGSFLALTAIVQTPAGVRPSRGSVVAFGLTTLLALYVGFDSVLLAAAQAVLVVVLFRNRARLVLGTLAGVAVLCVPLVILAVNRGSSQLFWVPKLSPAVLGQALTTLTSAGFSPNFHRTPTTAAVAGLTGVLLIAALAWAVRHRREHSSLTGLALVVLATWLLVPSVLAVGAALMGEPIELSRAAILLIPALSLLLAWGFWHPSLPRGAGLTLLVAVLALRALQLVPSYGVSPENWSAATNYVLAATRSDPACVAFYPQDGRELFDYYLQASGASASGLTPILPTAAWSRVQVYVERYRSLGTARRAQIASHCTSVWLIASHSGRRYGPLTSQRDYYRYRRLRDDLRHVYGIPKRTGFGYSARVHIFDFSR